MRRSVILVEDTTTRRVRQGVKQMTAAHRALVVGAGAAGAAAAILLAEQGISVDVVDAKPDVSALGSGITMQGNALRVLRQLGVWDQVREHGYPFDTLGLRAPDPAGTLVVELDDVTPAAPTCPPRSACTAPTLAQILVEPATEAGAKPVRHHLHRPRPGPRRRRRCLLRRVDRPLRRRHRRGRDPLLDPSRLRHRRRAPEQRAWASGASSRHARTRSPAPTSSTAAPATSPATARPARTPSTPTSSKTSQDRSGLTPRSRWR